MRRRFFIDKFVGNTAGMRGETADHLGRVLRAEVGQLYELSDGSSIWLARVTNVKLAKGTKSAIDFELVGEIPAPEVGLRLRAMISIVKFDRFEWCLEKATELGVGEITPLAAAWSDKPLIGAAAKRHERWEKIVLEAAQQSRQMRAPVLRAAIRPAEVPNAPAFTADAAATALPWGDAADAPDAVATPKMTAAIMAELLAASFLILTISSALTSRAIVTDSPGKLSAA